LQAVSVIVVSHGHEVFVRKLFDSLANYFEGLFEVILIDNLNDGRGFIEWIGSYGFKVVLVRNIKIYSFSRNNNMGVSISTFERIVLLNPDTWLEDTGLFDWLSVTDLSSNTLYFPRLLNPDGTDQEHCKKKPALVDQLVTFVFSLIGKRRSSPSGDYWCFAAAVVLQRELFIKLGGFDEVFHLYGEDTELCDRARKMGVSIEVLKEISVKHLLHNASKGRYIRKVIFSALYYRVKSTINSIRYGR
jgi:GT2 family glycosyltransferase